MQEHKFLNNSRVFNIARLAIGFFQGVLLYFLMQVNNFALNPAVMVVYFVPLLLMHGIGNMRIKKLVVWGAIVAIGIAGLSYYDNWRILNPVVAGSFHLFSALTLILFITHILIVAADTDRRWIARYLTYFDVAWKMWIQFGLAAVFLGVFWLLLWVGTILFLSINVDLFKAIIGQPWFYYPVSTLIVALAFNVMNVRPNLVQGVRTLILTLLSWLLPIITLITTGFLCALLFTGFLPLWKTSHATIILIIAVTSVIILINATYQDGNSEKPVPRLLRYSGRLAALTLAPIAVIAIYALSLRVGQYGWTTDRILVAFCVFVAGFYALGYMIAMLKSGAWLRFIEIWNVMAAVLISMLLILLLTPIADPARLFVIDQMARLQSGKISAEQFDFWYLHTDGERFGNQALLNLQKISDIPRASYIRERATAILKNKILSNNGSLNKGASTNYLTSAQKMQQIKMHLTNEQLPESFLKKDWSRTVPIPSCLLITTSFFCDLWMMDLRDDGRQEIILFDGKTLYGFEQDGQQDWKVIGFWGVSRCNPMVQQAVAAGQFKKVPSVWPDIQAMGYRIPFSRTTTEASSDCPLN